MKRHDTEQKKYSKNPAPSLSIYVNQHLALQPELSKRAETE